MSSKRSRMTKDQLHTGIAALTVSTWCQLGYYFEERRGRRSMEYDIQISNNKRTVTIDITLNP